MSQLKGQCATEAEWGVLGTSEKIEYSIESYCESFLEVEILIKVNYKKTKLLHNFS